MCRVSSYCYCSKNSRFDGQFVADAGYAQNSELPTFSFYISHNQYTDVSVNFKPANILKILF